MTLTIEMTPELEQQLRQAAKKAGLAPDTYVLQLLHQTLRPETSQMSTGTRLSKEEADLLQVINQSLPDIDYEQYHALIVKRQAETLTLDEQEELTTFSDRLEIANVARMQAVADLANLRQITLDSLMVELDLKPLVYG